MEIAICIGPNDIVPVAYSQYSTSCSAGYAAIMYMPRMKGAVTDVDRRYMLDVSQKKARMEVYAPSVGKIVQIVTWSY